MIIICALILSVQSQVDYELHVQYGKEKTHIGSIKIPKSKSQRPQITLETDTIIDKQKLHHFPYVTLYLEGGQKQYMAHVESSHITSLNIRGNLTEIINLALVNENLVSFDYQVKQSKKGAEKYFVQLKELLPAPQGQLAQEEEKPETQQEQPQGLFGLLSQYKWYIIIGFGLFYLTAQQDPQKLNESAQNAQEEAQQAQRRKK
ncbi:hypothetical protein pb186bvf_017239 [Paramecium bursaria]